MPIVGVPAHRFKDVAPLQKGVRGFVSSVLSAPGSEFGPSPMVMPGMVYQKAGVPLLRRLIGEQLFGDVVNAAVLEKPEITTRLAAKSQTPLVTANVAKTYTAITGKPITLVGFRTQLHGGPVPGRGTFYATSPEEVGSLLPLVPQKARSMKKGLTRTRTTGRSTDVIKLQNPFVYSGDTARGLMRRIIESDTGNSLPPKLLRAGQKILHPDYARKTETIEQVWTAQDKWVARAARALGHDGIIYKGSGEVVDLVGTKGK